MCFCLSALSLELVVDKGLCPSMLNLRSLLSPFVFYMVDHHAKYFQTGLR